MTRREAFRLLTGVCVSGVGSASGTGHVTEYRATATILLLSIPLFSRDGVGGGYFRFEESSLGAEKQVRLEFAAGSVPERAAGLSRLGMFEELIVESGGSLKSAAYFGFMSASGEQNLEQAKAALKQNVPGSFTAIRGRIQAGRIWNRLIRINGLPQANWTARQTLAHEIRARMEAQTGGETQVESGPGQAPCTFLYAVRRAMAAREPVTEQHFVHNGELLVLRTTLRAERDRKESRVSGQIRAKGGKELSSFQLWFDPAAAIPVPLRFEFRPRSFLRLRFDRTAA